MIPSNKSPYFLFFFIIVLLVSCATAKQKLQKGNYKGAFKKALSKLEKNRADRPHQRILSSSLEEMIKENDEKIQELALSEIKGLKKAVRLTESIKEYVDNAIPYTKERFIGTRDLLQVQIFNYEKKIGGIYFDEGYALYERAKSDDSKLDYKDAFLNFEDAVKYDTTIYGIKPLMDTCLNLAQRIIHVEADPTFDIMESWDIDRRFDDIEGYSDRFTKVYYENGEMKGKADCILDVEFRDLDFDISTNSTSEYFSEKIVTGYNTSTDTSGNRIEEPIYETVSGQVDKVTETKTGEWTVRVQVRGNSKDCALSDRNLDEETKSTIERYELSGDERAIPSRFKNPFDEDHKSEDAMSEDMIDNIFRRFVSVYF